VTPPQLCALEEARTVDLVPERRAPPTRDPTEMPFEDLMSNMLRDSRYVNPFQ
jgi:hypothetical protein